MYLRAMGFLNAIVFLSLGIVLAVTLKFPDVWVQMWTDALSKGDNKKGHRFWLGIYGLLEVLPLISLVGWIWHLFSNVVPAAGLSLHENLLRTVLCAPFPFISRVDSGNIMNRFNQDLMLIDSLLPFDLLNTVEELFLAVIQVILIAMASVRTLSVIPVVVAVLYSIQRFYLRTSKQLRLLELDAKEALHTKISDVAGGSGLSTIRAHGWRTAFRAEFMDKLDRSQEPVYLLYSVQRWLQVVLNLVVAGLVVVIAGVCVALRGRISAGSVGRDGDGVC
ncbi:putative canalicular multispecific organic anion transporter 1 protein [Phaeoacremonium minimum UCRPA7]|uniref:Putative canalicular multispecific organic anion transporter 1 protein n=1 Tax=Phaeoacremonium minimum (strain UCR-PA7) TaxID=1286976 RepID=R8BRF8_PHAM7|nr:putative canalicular multispecific organic anion transporter 1 protein [Phaeoacremonium minimum UCRPA7]EOO01865.1 putative canalicular multispecific organic anion transporter 1 protein [Phaeoacremonium minimum UCRPA7]